MIRFVVMRSGGIAFGRDPWASAPFIIPLIPILTLISVFPKTPMHHGFSSQHTVQDIDKALNIMEDALREL